jgi:hypothetical protein
MALLSFSLRAVKIAAIVSALGLVGGCASVESKPTEQVVAERAQARWDALLKGDVEGAYGYLSPGSRAVNTLEAYKSSIRENFWKAARVGKATCASEACEVAAEVEYEFRRSRVKTPLSETWVKQEGNWWYVLK